MVLIDNLTRSRLHDGRRAIRLLAGAAIVLGVVLVAAGAALGRGPVTEPLNAAFAIAWLLEAGIVATAFGLRIVMARNERVARAAATRRIAPRRKSDPRTTTQAWEPPLFAGPPGWAEARLVALVVLYGVGGLWLAVGFSVNLEPGRSAGTQAAGWGVWAVSAAILVPVVIHLHKVGHRWRQAS